MNDKPLKSWDTRVAMSKSQEDIRSILHRFGVVKISFEEDFETGSQILRFVYPVNENTKTPVQLKIEIKGIYDWLCENGRQSWTHEYIEKQSKKVAWRHLLDWVKVNINLVEFGLIPFENIFLSYFSQVLPDGSYQNLGEYLIPQIKRGSCFNPCFNGRNF